VTKRKPPSVLVRFFNPKGDIPVRVSLVASSIPFGIVFLTWCLLSYSGYVPYFFLPSPTAVLGATIKLVTSEGLINHAWVSFYRISFGFVAAAVLAVPLGILMGSFRIVQALIEPINDFIRYLPVAAFIPLAILWTGIGDFEKVVIIFIGTFFQLILLVAENARIVPAEYLEVAYTLGGSRWAAITKVLTPAASPAILDSLRIAVGWAWSYLVVAEIVAANRGLGYLIIQGQRFLKTPQIVAVIFIIGLIGLSTDQLFRLASHRLFPWRRETHH